VLTSRGKRNKLVRGFEVPVVPGQDRTLVPNGMAQLDHGQASELSMMSAEPELLHLIERRSNVWTAWISARRIVLTLSGPIIE